MKKILQITTFLLFSTLGANAEFFTVGVTGTAGLLSAKGTETVSGLTSSVSVIAAETAGSFQTFTTESTSKTSKVTQEDIFYGTGSVFAEMNFGPDDFKVSIGLDYVPYDIESETTENARNGGPCVFSNGQACADSKDPTSNTIAFDLQDLTTAYASVKFKGLYVRYGQIEADIITRENLGTGSSYGNAELEGTVMGVGYEYKRDSGYFIRGEVNETDFESIKLVADSASSENTNTINIEGMSGTTAAFSIGKSF
jgi:hypothetical protein